MLSLQLIYVYTPHQSIYTPLFLGGSKDLLRLNMGTSRMTTKYDHTERCSRVEITSEGNSNNVPTEVDSHYNGGNSELNHHLTKLTKA